MRYHAVGKIISSSLRPAVALSVVTIAILASTLLFQVLFLRAALLGVDRTHRIISGEQELLKLNVDMETGVRGFQYTGNAEFLQPYAEAAQVVDSKFAALNQLVSDNPSQRAQVASIRGSFEQWKLAAEKTIARRADVSIREPDQDRFDQMLKGKASMDAIRAQYAAFDSDEMLLRTKYLREVNRGYLLGGVIFFVIVFGAGIVVALSFRRHQRRSAVREEQEELRRRDEKLRRMVWAVKDYAILMLDTTGHVVTWNEGAQRIKGYRAEEIIGRHFSTFYPADVAAIGKPALELKIAEEKGRYEEEGWRVRQDGSQYWASVVITALRDEDGRLSGFAKVIRDMPEPKDTEQALLTAEALQKAIFNSANFSKIATDAKGVIQIFNVGAEHMLGYKAIEVMNKVTPADISDPQEVIARARALSAEVGTPIAPGFEALVFKASRGIEDIYELTYIRKDGSRFPAVVSVSKALGKEMDRQEIVMRITPEGFVISLHELGFFNSGEAQLLPGAAEKIKRLALVLKQYGLDMRVEGHSDNVPIHNASFTSNWELSTARATVVAMMLLNDSGFDPKGLSIAGYAQYHPAESNDTPQGRRANRRVDIVVLSVSTPSMLKAQ